MQKYANLTYHDYLKQYILPLVPKYVEALETQAKSSNLSIAGNTCNLTLLLVVDFRDPK